MTTHVVQSQEWGEFKTEMGTPAIRSGTLQYTKHKIPFTNYYLAYAPKTDPSNINWAQLEKSLKENECVAINLDVPNIEKSAHGHAEVVEILKDKCIKSPKNTFAKFNILLDISKSETELLAKMHKKHRYNIGLAERRGVKTRRAKNTADFDTFYNLLKTAAEKQKYYIHTEHYYQKVWEMLGEKEMAHILITEYNNAPIASWMLFVHDNVLYYPYGGSNEKYKKLHGNCQIGWETIKLGKKLGCHTFDMWGAAKNPNDKTDPWYGFTNFKLKFGGVHVEYCDSYDFVINKNLYQAFSLANNIRWKALGFLKKI